MNEEVWVCVEVSLTILRNFADSLAHVDHVRPAQGVLPRVLKNEGVRDAERW